MSEFITHAKTRIRKSQIESYSFTANEIETIFAVTITTISNQVYKEFWTSEKGAVVRMGVLDGMLRKK